MPRQSLVAAAIQVGLFRETPSWSNIPAGGRPVRRTGPVQPLIYAIGFTLIREWVPEIPTFRFVRVAGALSADRSAGALFGVFGVSGAVGDVENRIEWGWRRTMLRL